MKSIILASKSKVRKKILDENKIECIVEPSNLDEDEVKKSLINQGATPEIISKNLAELKANKVSQKKLGEIAPDQYDLSEVQVDPEDPVVKAVLDFGKEKQLSNKSITGLINKVIEITGGVEEEAELDISREREKLGVNAQEIIQLNIIHLIKFNEF